jgi:4-hydroxysphinganine ceramide fatty acyl 2-hydroxylase
MDPPDLSVLFVNPLTSIPLLVALAAIAALALDVEGLFCAMIATNFLAFTYYEFMHAASHLNIRFHNSWIAPKKKSHLFHHFVSEKQNYGIGSNIIDGVTGHQGQATTHSPTVQNLGYNDEVAARYPWVREGYEKEKNR